MLERIRRRLDAFAATVYLIGIGGCIGFALALIDAFN